MRAPPAGCQIQQRERSNLLNRTTNLFPKKKIPGLPIIGRHTTMGQKDKSKDAGGAPGGSDRTDLTEKAADHIDRAVQARLQSDAFSEAVEAAMQKIINNNAQKLVEQRQREAQQAAEDLAEARRLKVPLPPDSTASDDERKERLIEAEFYGKHQAEWERDQEFTRRKIAQLQAKRAAEAQSKIDGKPPAKVPAFVIPEIGWNKPTSTPPSDSLVLADFPEGSDAENLLKQMNFSFGAPSSFPKMFPMASRGRAR